MNNKYNPAIHHRRSIRLKGYDYSQAGLYFVTICVHNRQCVFGEIRTCGDCRGAINRAPTHRTPTMQLNEYGKIAQMVWNELPQHYSNIQLGEFIVMPNHIHGIIEIRGGVDGNTDMGAGCRAGADCRGAINRAPTVDDAVDDNEIINGGFARKNNPMFYDNLSRIIRWFKGRITFECRKSMPYFAWQRNYHEHIIRDQKSYETISEYIINNPQKWKNDKFYIKM